MIWIADPGFLNGLNFVINYVIKNELCYSGYQMFPKFFSNSHGADNSSSRYTFVSGSLSCCDQANLAPEEELSLLFIL